MIPEKDSKGDVQLAPAETPHLSPAVNQPQQRIYTSLSQLEDIASFLKPEDLEGAYFIFAAMKGALEETSLPQPLKDALLKADQEGRVAFRKDGDYMHPYKHAVAFLREKGITVPESLESEISIIYDRADFHKALTAVGLKVELSDVTQPSSQNASA